MKALVETKGSFQLFCAEQDKYIRHEGYTVVTLSHFLHSRAALGQVSFIAELNEDATDEEWLKYVDESDGDIDLAREAFLSKYSVDAEEESETDSKPRKPRQARKAH